MITALRIEDLGLSRGERTLVEGLELSLVAGEALALTGPNGSGKTTLLRAIAGFVRPDHGDIAFEGAEGRLDPDDARAGGLHLVGHNDGLKPARTGAEELAFFAGWAGAEAAGVGRAIDRLRLGPLLDLEVRKLSAGQRRRLALARLIAAPRPLWLLDEPLAPLDGERRAVMGAVMQAHLDEGGMILAAVHDPLPLPARSVRLGAPA